LPFQDFATHTSTAWGWRKLRDIYNKHENHLILTPLAINRYRQQATAETAARMQSELSDDMQSSFGSVRLGVPFRDTGLEFPIESWNDT